MQKLNKNLEELFGYQYQIEIIRQEKERMVLSLIPWQQKKSRLVAKLQINSKGVGDQIFENLRREYQIWSSLKHENILNLDDYYCQNQGDIDYEFFLAPRIQSDLFLKIKQSYPTIDVQGIRRYFLQIGKALMYLHEERQIIHNDIKLSNIVCDQNSAYLIDFEFSSDLQKFQDCEYTQNHLRQRGCRNQSPQLVGLIEDLRKNKKPLSREDLNQIDWKKNDIFALGVSLFESLFFFNPFKDGVAKIQQAYYQQPDLFWQNSQIQQLFTKNQVPVSLQLSIKSLINQCLSYEQSTRISAKQFVQNKFFQSSQ